MLAFFIIIPKALMITLCLQRVGVVNRPVTTQALPPPKDVCTDSVGGAVSFQSTGVFALLTSCVIASMLLVTIAQ